MTDFAVNVYDRELMRKFALLRGGSEERFAKRWRTFETDRQEWGWTYVQLKLAQIARRTRVGA